jgi:hypothetical protein
MDIINASKPLPEIKRRIKAVFADIQDSEVHVDRFMINDKHSIHFEIRNKDYAFKGTITKRTDMVKVIEDKRK